jgi:hypothetical protein
MYNVIRWIEDVALAEDGLTPAPELNKRVEALRELGRDWRRMNGTQFQEAMTTAHFATYFSFALSKAFLDDYNYQAGEWMQYTAPDTAPDFRDVQRARMTMPGTLQLRREKAEPKATEVHDNWIHYGVDEYAEQFDVSWQTIMNDDLGEIRRTPQRMALAAKLWLDTWVSALYDNAVFQGTQAARGAPWAMTGRLTQANLAIGIADMMIRTDAAGHPLNFRRIHLVIPPILVVQAHDIIENLSTYGGPGTVNLAQYIAGIHVDPYIGWAGINIPWYLFADPSEVPAVPVLRLEGWPGPVVSQKASDIRIMQGSAPAAFTMGSFATGDIEYMVEDVIGGWADAADVGVADFRAVLYSSGTTP